MVNTSAIVILNAKSGKGNTGDIEQRLRSMAAMLGVRCEIVSVRRPALVIEAARKAAKSDCDIVIAGGGDGTINTVAGELVGTGKRLGVLPLGTFNYFAREMGMPTDLDEAFRTCFEGETRSVTVGEVNGRVFLNNASIGLYPFILAIREQVYRRWGRSRPLAYWSVLSALLRLRLDMQLLISWEDQRRIVHTPLLFVARNATQLEEFRIPGVRCVSEDGFSVYALRSFGRLGLLRVAWRSLTGTLKPQADYETICTASIRVESRRMRRIVAYDGERVKMLSPIEFRVRQNALRIVVPRKWQEIAV